MGLKSDLKAEVKSIFGMAWEVRKTASVPIPTDLRLKSNEARDLERATVLYADLESSTAMVDQMAWQISAEVYKTFLKCAGQIIKTEGGVISAYDGDRVMAIFVGDRMAHRAVRSGLMLNHAVREIIQPALARQYGTALTVGHVVGIDCTQLRCARVGVHGENDLVWIGRAANYAAKLTSIPGHSTWITKAVYDSISVDLKRPGVDNLWKQHTWKQMNSIPIFGTDAYIAFT